MIGYLEIEENAKIRLAAGPVGSALLTQVTKRPSGSA
jgi:hypothetical protein